jgi:hypothetical protein
MLSEMSENCSCVVFHSEQFVILSCVRDMNWLVLFFWRMAQSLQNSKFFYFTHKATHLSFEDFKLNRNDEIGQSKGCGRQKEVPIE